jgi:hypothetical protein
MSVSHKTLIWIGAVMLLLSLGFSWSVRRDLQSVRHELATVNQANEFLKKALGDMTIAIAAKEREIDRLQNSACGSQNKAQPGAPVRPGHNRVSESDAVPSGNNQRNASSEPR